MVKEDTLGVLGPTGDTRPGRYRTSQWKRAGVGRVNEERKRNDRSRTLATQTWG